MLWNTYYRITFQHLLCLCKTRINRETVKKLPGFQRFLPVSTRFCPWVAQCWVIISKAARLIIPQKIFLWYYEPGNPTLLNTFPKYLPGFPGENRLAERSGWPCPGSGLHPTPRRGKNWLVVYLPLWNIWVRQLGSLFPWKNTPFMFQTTNQIRFDHVRSSLHRHGPGGDNSRHQVTVP